MYGFVQPIDCNVKHHIFQSIQFLINYTQNGNAQTYLKSTISSSVQFSAMPLSLNFDLPYNFNVGQSLIQLIAANLPCEIGRQLTNVCTVRFGTKELSSMFFELWFVVPGC